MNENFCSLGEKLAKNIPVTGTPPEPYIGKRASTQFVFTPVTEEQVYHVISKLSISKSCGLDKISSRLLKPASPYISDVIRDIINQSFDMGISPDDWKMTKVSPVYKADARNVADNYRPISILLAILKVIERIVHTQILEFFTENNLLSKFQSGYRGMHSTCTAILLATDSWLRNMDEGLITRNVFIDLKKVFDTVDHATLLRKLNYYRVQANL